MIKKTLSLALACVFLLGLVVWIISHSNSPDKSSEAMDPKPVAGNEPGKKPSGPSIISLQEPIQPSDPQPNPRWLDPIILRVLNSETTWNDSGTEKTVVNIVEADFHHPWLRIEETYSVDARTGMESLEKYIPSVADELLVQFKSSLTPQEISELENQYHIRCKPSLRGTSIVRVEIANFSNPDRFSSLLKSLNSESDVVVLAEPDFLVRAFSTIPNDPIFAEQTGFSQEPLNGLNRDIDAPEAWDIRTNASSIVVAVIDSGININHPDLNDNIWRNSLEQANGMDDDQNDLIDDLHGVNFIDTGKDPTDESGHGTLVAGVIGAEGNNGIGVAGVAWDIQLMALKFLGPKGQGTTGDAISSIHYAISKNAHIINNSWGGSGRSRLLEEVLLEASDAGIMIVTSAGNSGDRLSDSPTYPAAYQIPNQVVVGASDQNDRLSRYSNYDEELVHLLAPGFAYSTIIQDGLEYDGAEGTSLSAPHVSGSLALLKSEFPTLTAGALINRLLDASEYRENLDQVCLSKGRLNAARALRGESNIPANDDFSEARGIPQAGGTFTESLTFATLEDFEPMPYSDTEPNTVWYRWESPRSDSATLKLSTPSFRGSMAVFTGDSLNNLSLVEKSRSANSGGSSILEFTSTVNSSYFIQVSRVSGFGGYFKLSLALAPPNDLLANAITVSGNEFSIEGSTTLATLEPNEPVIHPSGAGNTVWYKWLAPKSGNLFLVLDSLKGQMFVSIYEEPTPSLVRVDFILDRGLPHLPLFEAQAETTYYFGVDSQSENGNPFVLSGEFLESPRITLEPVDTVARVGGEAAFNVAVLGRGEAIFQWFFNDQPIAGADQQYLLLTDVQPEDEGDYHVTIEINGFMLRSLNASLTLSDEVIQMLAHPQSEVILQGSSTVLKVFAQPSSQVNYQWYKNDTLLIEENGSEIIIPDAQLEDTGYYSVEIKLGGRRVRSRNAYLRVVEGNSVFAGTAWSTTKFGNPNMHRIAKAGDYYFALGQESKLAFSKDGSHWNYTSAPRAGDFITSVSYGDGVYVITASQGIYWSTDLFEWEKADIQLDSLYESAYGNGVFVAVNFFGFHRSNNGTDWSTVETAMNYKPQSVTWAGDRFVAVGVFDEILTSQDGSSWQQIGTSSISNPRRLFYDGELIWNSAFKPAYSSDGITWTQLEPPDFHYEDFAIDLETGRKFLLSGLGLFERVGAEWKLVQSVPAGITRGLVMDGDQAIVTLDGMPGKLTDLEDNWQRFGRLHSGVFAKGKFFAQSDGQWYSSANGTDWTISFENLEAYTGEYVTNGEGIEVRLSGSDILFSSDGVTWKVAKTIAPSSNSKLFFGGGKFFFTNGDQLWTSIDGEDWTLFAGRNPIGFDLMAYGNNVFVGLDENGRHWISHDGFTWEEQPKVLSEADNNLEFFGGRFIAITGGQLLESADGVDWKTINAEVQGYEPDQLVQGNGRLIMLTEFETVVWEEGEGEPLPPFLSVSGVAPLIWAPMGESIQVNTRSFSNSSSVSKIEVFDNNVLLARLEPSGDTFRYTVPSIGSHKVLFKATDSNGLTTTQTISIQGIRNLITKVPNGGPISKHTVYFKGAFYGAGPGGLVFQSLNGTEWNQIQTPCTTDLMGFHHNDIGICALGSGNELVFSKDGVHWIQIPLPSASWIFRSNEPSFLAVDRYLSANGSDWYSADTGQLILGDPLSPKPDLPYEFVQYNLPTLVSPGKSKISTGDINNYYPWYTVKFGESMFTALENVGVFKIENSLEWQDVTPPGINLQEINEIQSVGNGLFLIVNDPVERVLSYFSSDGFNWESINGPTVIGNIVFKEGKFYCGNQDGLFESSDGIIWNIIGTGPFKNWTSLDSNQLISTPIGFLSSVYESNEIAITGFSEDGKQWQFQEAAFKPDIKKIVGGGKNIHTVRWGEPTYSLSESKEWQWSLTNLSTEAVWGNGIFLDNSINTARQMRTSDDGWIWDEYPLPEWFEGHSLDRMFFDGVSGFWYFSRNTEFLAKSPDGRTWEKRTYPGLLYDILSVPNFKGKIYAGNYVSDDDGHSWMKFFENDWLTHLAATEDRLIAYHIPEHEPEVAFITSGDTWTQIPIPDTGTLTASKDTFYLIGTSWTFASKDGFAWEPKALSPQTNAKASVIDHHPYIYGEDLAIREISVVDLAIENLQVTDGEYGVGDSLPVELSLKNAGEETIQFTNDLEITLLLSQRANAWGIGPDGYHISSGLTIPSLDLAQGESRLLNTNVVIPETVRPGKYFLSALIGYSSRFPDSNASNNYFLGDHPSVIIPERQLHISLNGQGTVLSEKPLFEIPNKQFMRLVPTPSFGYEFSSWSGDLEATSDVGLLMMDSDKEVEALFAPRTFRMDIQMEGRGLIKGAPESGYANFNDILDLEAEPNPSWQFLGWFGDRLSQDTHLSIQVGRDLRLSARFGQPLDSWLEEKFSPEELLDPDTGGILGDPDKNGFTNLQEFLFGLEHGTRVPPRFEVFRDGDDVCLVYPRSLTTIGPERLDVWYSKDFSDWKTDGLEERVVREEAAVEYVEVRKHNPWAEPLFFEIRAVAE